MTPRTAGRTVALASATVLALLLGYPLAYFIASRRGAWKNILLVLVIAPFFTSFLIRTLAWQTILADRYLPAKIARWTHFTDLLQFLHLSQNDSLLSSKFAVICGLTYNFLPFMILPLFTSLDRLDGRLLEAAGDLYATPRETFRYVTWPLSLPGETCSQNVTGPSLVRLTCMWAPNSPVWTTPSRARARPTR